MNTAQLPYAPPSPHRPYTLIAPRQSRIRQMVLVAEPPAKFYGAKQRVYVDTSVVGGCRDNEFRVPSQRLFDAFVRSEHTLVLSQLTSREVAGAPQGVRDVLSSAPRAHIEDIDESEEAQELVRAYIDAGALAQSMEPDARHIAMATVARVDYLVSWNFKHIVNDRRIGVCRSVNAFRSLRSIKITSPGDIKYHA